MKNTTFIFSLFVLMFAVFVSAEAQTNATIPYSCNFETTSDYTNWVIPTASPSPTNRWYIGNATNSTLSTGSRAAYISNNSGTSAAYTVTSSSISSIYRQFNTVAGEKYEITFDYKLGGEAYYDFLTVYWVDNATVAVNGWVTANTYGWYTAGNPYIVEEFGPSDWVKRSIYVTGNGSPAKLVFYWTNNPSIGTQPGACIDNVEVKKITVSPANIPYYCDFEDSKERNNWIIPTSPTVNKWVIGTATYSPVSLSHSAYISNNNGTNAAYTFNATNVLPIYREFNTVNGANYRIYFDFMVAGEGNASTVADFLGMYWVTDPSVPVSSWASTTYAVPVNSAPHLLAYLQGEPSWITNAYVDVVGNGSPSKLVFLWFNNNANGTNPGGCFDNIRIVDLNKKYDNSIWVNKDTPYSTYTPEKLVKDIFVKGGDCAVSNVKFTGLGWDEPSKTWTGTADKRSLAYFDHGTLPGLGMTDGLLMTTGYAKAAEGPNVWTETMSGGNTTGLADADIGALVGGTSNIKTISILEFDFVPGTSSISFDYIFASEEYPEYGCSSYNDVFGFFISGPGITGKKNIAVLPDNTTAVAIKNLHPEDWPMGFIGCSALNEQYYVDGTGNQYTEFDGHTKMLTTMAQTVQPGQTYQLKLAIANISDEYVGSGVFLRAGSLDLGLGLSNQSGGVDAMNNVFEGCGTNQFVLKLNPTGSSIPVTLSYSGTATGRITKPDGTAMPSSVIIPAGTSTYPIPYIVSSSCPTNGGYVTITATFNYCGGTPVTFTETIYVYKKVNPTVSYTTACGATSALVTFGVPTGQGTPKVKFKIDTESTWHPINGYSTTLSTGSHTMHIQDSVSCIYDVPFVVNPRANAYGSDPQTACESYTWLNGTTYYSSISGPTFTIIGGAKNGCDSIVTLNLTINNTKYGTDVKNECNEYTWIDGITYASSTSTPTYTFVKGAKNGCDSIVTLNLTISDVVYGIDVQTACDSYTWIDGFVYTSNNNTATFTIPNGSSHGCDSIVTLNLTVNNATNGIDTQTACGSYKWIDGFVYTSNNNTATYTIPNGSSHGCDSIITLNLTVNNATNGIDTQTACGSYTWIDGFVYTSNNNTATHTIPNGAKNGCDSIVTLNLTVNQQKHYLYSKEICQGDSYPFGGKNLTENGLYRDTIVASNGCDSIITVNLTVTNTKYGIDVKTACNNYTWINGVTYTSSTNTPTHTLTSAAGCDSIVTLNLTINNTKYGIDTKTACNSYTWINGVTYTSSTNTPTHTLTSTAGCDSIVTLNLTVKSITYGTDTKVACNSYTWINGVTYTSSTNTPTHTLTSVAGCDSIVTLNLTITNKTYGTDTKITCGSYTWINGVTYTSNNNTATHTITNAEGCDSIVTLNLTIIDDKVSVQISEPICADDGYFSLMLSNSTDAVLPTNYKVDFAEKTVPSGFSNFVNQQGIISSNEIFVQMPTNVYPDKYTFTLTLSSNIIGCEDQSYVLDYCYILYPKSIMEQKWNNVISLLNEYYNGGYKFYGYQWYRNDQQLPGETHSYIYLQNGNLVQGDLYTVLITREDGTQMLSCPFEAHIPNAEIYTNPTIVNGGEVIKISLPDHDATVRLITVTGIVLSSQKVNSGCEIVAPIQQGVYLLEILSGNTSNVTKIIVR